MLLVCIKGGVFDEVTHYLPDVVSRHEEKITFIHVKDSVGLVTQLMTLEEVETSLVKQ